MADGYTFLDPQRLVLDIWIADINDCDTYDDNVATANSLALGLSIGGFRSMDEEPDGLGGDPCSITNLLQPFYVTSIQRTNAATTITWQSCPMFRYLVQSADALSTNTAWATQSYTSYVWGQPAASATSWIDLSTTNTSIVTQRFYRVQRLLGSPIAAGAEHSVALAPDGKLWAWGRNDANLGDDLDSGIQVNGDYVEEYLPYPGNVTPITSCIGQTISNAAALAAGGDDFTVVADANGAVWTFGENTEGQLGIGSGGFKDPNFYPVPSRISGVSNVVSVAAGFQHALALRADGTVFAWGLDMSSEFASGALGVGSLPSGETNAPVQSLVPTGTFIVAIAAGDGFSLALDTTGLVWGWGGNGVGEIGATPTPGADASTNLPILVAGISNVIAIAAGVDHTVALTADKRVWTWGGNVFGQLGDGTTSTRAVPAPVFSNAVAIAAGYDFSVVVASNGWVYGWGDDSFGQLGTNTCNGCYFSTPIRVSGISNVVWISAPVSGDGANEIDDVGGTHVVGITLDQGTNHYWGWGDNFAGEVGNGISGYAVSGPQATNQYTPAQVQFCTRCQRTVQLGTNGSFTAQCNGTLYLYFNDEIGAFSDNAGSFTVTVNGITTNVLAFDNTGYGIGVAVGTVTNGGAYPYTASGSCLYVRTIPSTATDPNGNAATNGVPWDCSDFTLINITNAVCPTAKCFSLVGKIQ